jgi:hypothetical protein
LAASSEVSAAAQTMRKFTCPESKTRIQNTSEEKP